MGSGQSIISKEDMEAYKQLTYFTEAEIKNCLQKFSELLDPATPMKSVHDPQASVSLIHHYNKYKRMSFFFRRGFCMKMWSMDCKS